MVERWCQVSDFPFYEISTEGKLRTWRRRGGKWRDEPVVMDGAMRKGKYGGYVVYFLCQGEDPKRHKRYAHRLVAEAFLPPPRPGQTEVAHWDGDPSNNRVENLRWATHEENHSDRTRHGTNNAGITQWMARLTDEAVAEIRRRYAAGEPQAEIQKDFGLTQGHVSQIVNRKIWKHVR